MDQKVLDLIKAQVEEVQSQHPDFDLLILDTGEPETTGTLTFDIEHDGRRVRDAYAVRVRFPPNYPMLPPYVWETEGCIPPDFGHFMKAGNLCLGAPIDLKEKFALHRNLLTFLNEQVVPYLFSYSHKRDHGNMPFGELCHGPLGLLTYYMDRFQTLLVPTLKLLKGLADNFIPPEGLCACGRRLTFRKCHGPLLMDLRTHQSPADFEGELRGILKHLQAPELAEFLTEQKIVIPVRAVTPKRVLRRLDRRSRS